MIIELIGTSGSVMLIDNRNIFSLSPGIINAIGIDYTIKTLSPSETVKLTKLNPRFLAKQGKDVVNLKATQSVIYKINKNLEFHGSDGVEIIFSNVSQKDADIIIKRWREARTGVRIEYAK